MNITKMQTVIANEILAERNRQDAFVADGTFPFNCSDRKIADWYKLPVLVEEVGEVAKEVYELSARSDRQRDKLYTEPIQVAAVCMAWAEGIKEGK